MMVRSTAWQGFARHDPEKGKLRSRGRAGNWRVKRVGKRSVNRFVDAPQDGCEVAEARVGGPYHFGVEHSLFLRVCSGT
jgi:hypothetical protein